MWPLAVDSIILKSTSDTKNDKNIFQEAVLIVFEHLELCQSTLVYDYSSYELLFFSQLKIHDLIWCQKFMILLNKFAESSK